MIGRIIGKSEPVSPAKKADAGRDEPSDSSCSYQDDDTCYICASSASRQAPLLQVCSCSCRIHLRCQQEVIDKMPSYSTRCSVCHAEYNNVTTDHSYITVTIFGWLVLLIVLIKCALIALDVWLFVEFANDPNIGTIVSGILLALTIFCTPIAYFPLAIGRAWFGPRIFNPPENYVIVRHYEIKAHPQPVKKIKTKASPKSRCCIFKYLDACVYDPRRPAKPEEGMPQRQGMDVELASMRVPTGVQELEPRNETEGATDVPERAAVRSEGATEAPVEEDSMSSTV